MKATTFLAMMLVLASASGCKAAAPDGLDFTKAAYQDVTLKYNGTDISFRYYQDIYYVASPVDSVYQKMNLYIPAEYFKGASVNGYTAETAPIFLYHKIAGYTPAKASTLASAVRKRGPRPGDGPGGPGGPGGRPEMGGPGNGGGPSGPMGGPGREPEDESLIPSEINDNPEHPFMPIAAMLRGYVVAAPGARGRLNDNGRAPAALIDLKAAVRYLKFNDKAMPGDASKIISDGTSAGGALSSLLGATGNHPDYEPYLTALGAAPATDDIFATQAYCPITNLEHADAAYEWTYGSLESAQHGEITPEMKAFSDELKAQFAPYVNSLSFKSLRDETLYLEADGTGSFLGWVCHFLREAAQEQLDKGADLSAYDWVEVKDGKVGEIYFDKYVRFAGRKKAPIAFDALDLSSAENNEFGTESIEKQHFTSFSFEHSQAEGSTLADPKLVYMMNPMNYIPDEAAVTSPHWRICHGTKDSDTSPAIPILLGTCLLNNGFDTIIRLTWDQPHGGDYDTNEQFDWIDSICK